MQTPEPPAGVAVDRFQLPGGQLISLDVRPGELVLLEGPNGSGKTTLLRHLAGLAPQSELWAAAAPTRPTPRGTHLVMQDARDTLAGLTVAGEFRLRQLPRPGSLHALADRDVATLSSGEARKVALAVADCAQGHLLLLDEPAEGLDAAAKVQLLGLVAKAKEAGAVLAVDHTGTLAQAADRRVALAPLPKATLGPIPFRPNAPVVMADAAVIRRGNRMVKAPALHLPAGFHVLVGPNGSGKSTLLLRLAGLLRGRGVAVQGHAPQPGTSVRLLLPRARDLFTRPTVAAEVAGLQDTGLVPSTLLARHPLALSGGEAQRLALAKTFGRPAPVYLLDEPEANLDADGLARFWTLVRSKVDAGACVLAATHDATLQGLAHTTVQMEVPDAA